MATAEHIKMLIQSHFDDNSDRFNTIVLQLAAYEANKGHSNLARDLKDIIDNAKRSQKKVIPFNRELSDLIISSHPNQRLSELVVDDNVKERITRILQEYRHRDKLMKFGMGNRRKILFAGPPGTGKTMTASILASELGLPLCTIMMDKMVTKYMGETSAKLRQVFDTISSNPGVYLFDEFDAIGAERSLDNDVGEIRRVLNSFLQLIEQDQSEGLIVAATNNHKMLDQALFRRFDDVIHYDLPHHDEIDRLIRNRLANFIHRDVKLDKVVEICESLSHAEITKACEDSIKNAILNDQMTICVDDLMKMVNEKRYAYSKGDVGDGRTRI